MSAFFMIITVRTYKGGKGDKEDKGDSSEKEKYICKNGMLPITNLYQTWIPPSVRGQDAISGRC